ncbi:MAG: hypothetical protein CFE21_05785 [Bacteroidetes bacterium B1(2017)]|nr:MAG: hypothetical protein CFE21_05785 [Bacteroidetes bacterium B1(2017)]
MPLFFMKTLNQIKLSRITFIICIGYSLLLPSTIKAQTKLLLSENFETGIWPPAGWAVKTSASITAKPISQTFPNFYENWFLNETNLPLPWGSNYIFEGDASAAVGGTNLGFDPTFDWLITDTFSNENTNTLSFNYWMFMHSDSLYPTLFYILGKYSSDSSWSILKQFTYSKEFNHYNSEVAFALSTLPNKTLQVAFVHNSTYQFAIDNISIQSFTTGLGQELKENANIELYPNPGIEKINLRIPIELVGSGYSIINLTGQIILNGILTKSETQFDLNALKSGMYLISLSDPAGRIWNKKFVKN